MEVFEYKVFFYVPCLASIIFFALSVINISGSCSRGYARVVSCAPAICLVTCGCASPLKAPSSMRNPPSRSQLSVEAA